MVERLEGNGRKQNSLIKQSFVFTLEFPLLIRTLLWLCYFRGSASVVIDLYHSVHMYVCPHLVSLGLQSVVERPGLLELLAELIRLLLVLLLHTLPLPLKLR